MSANTFLFLMTLGFQAAYVGCLDCYQCKHIQDPTDCYEVAVCPNDSLCALESATVGSHTSYNMSCKPKQECTSASTTSSPVSIIGRRRRATDGTHCSECCSRDACNKQLCSASSQGGACVDDLTFDCAHINTLYPVCADVTHAKLVCRQYCNLCDLVDGSWTTWSSWSNCDVTCDNGTIVRTRSCTDPAPAHGGSNCSGMNRQQSTCNLQACPVHGGWSIWSTWNNCSVSCGIGLQTRRRTCSNPFPDRFGDHCFGDNLENKACFLRACADGGWSGWSSWGVCSATCNGGIQNRTRRCDNPVPSVLGRDCPGDYNDFQACHGEACPVVVFMARNVVDISPARGSLIRFDTAVVNIGGAYSPSTGYFTVPYTGLYSFTVHICTYRLEDLYVEIVANGKMVGTARSFDKDGDVCSSGDGLAELKAGDQVWIKCDGAPSNTVIYQDSNTWNSFSGRLIQRTA